MQPTTMATIWSLVVALLCMPTLFVPAIADTSVNTQYVAPPILELDGNQYLALQMAVARFEELPRGYNVKDFDIYVFDKGYEYLFLFLHHSRGDSGITMRGGDCNGEMPAYEIGVSKDASRITRAYCPR